jgi:hypothetical protein
VPHFYHKVCRGINLITILIAEMLLFILFLSDKDVNVGSRKRDVLVRSSILLLSDFIRELLAFTANLVAAQVRVFNYKELGVPDAWSEFDHEEPISSTHSIVYLIYLIRAKVLQVPNVSVPLNHLDHWGG